MTASHGQTFNSLPTKPGDYLVYSVVNELLRLTLLAPDIIERLMAGRQPCRMNLIWFQRNPLPIEWEAQRQIVKRFEEEV